MAATSSETQHILPARDTSAGYHSFDPPRFYLSSTSGPESEGEDTERLLHREHADYSGRRDE
jgi:hypothetical protein